MRGEGLYDPSYEQDSCGVGMAVNVDGKKDHSIVEYGLRILENMAHRGAENADGKTGDGAGILVQIPHDFIVSQGVQVPEAGRYGTGIVFLPADAACAEKCMDVLRSTVSSHGLVLLAEREVPVDHSVPGPMASATEPRCVQVFVTSYDGPEMLEHKLFRVRKIASNRVSVIGGTCAEDFYICSLSNRTMVYKGMLTPAQLREYYKDLSDPRFKSSVAMVHSRFSTNTFPMWKLAQPFRMLCHNGEINTIRGNRSWMRARESVMRSEWVPDLGEVYPVVQEGMSDSASLDNVFEFLTMTGKSMPNALSILIPESWNNKNPIPDSLKAYYEYHSILMEPWDGPAAVLFTDGRYAGGMLDRNGLRPTRYTLTKDGVMIMASESGVIQVSDDNVQETGRLRPGKMLMIDTATGSIRRDADIKGELAAAYPYRDWLEKNRVELDQVSSGREVGRSFPDHRQRLISFGYSSEDVTKGIEPMASTGKEPVGAMGFDAPLAVLSSKPQRLFSYFRQSFAQVTNPPIDPIREELVMSVTGYVGSIHQNILDPTPKHCKVVKLKHPIITNRELDLVRNLRYKGFNTAVLQMTFPVKDGPAGMEKAIRDLCRKAEAAVDGGYAYIVLSDREAGRDRAPIPSLLAVSAVHQHLVERRKRIQTALVVESGEPREVMHFALLFGYGANAVNPYMAIAVIDDLCRDGQIHMDVGTAEANYIHALEKGLLKIMSKMGIATLRSYRGSCLFEAVGLSESTVRAYFGGTVSSVGGIGTGDIAREALEAHGRSFLGTDANPLETDTGVYSYKSGGELHSWNPASVRALHRAVRGDDQSSYDEFARMEDEGMFFLRDLMDIKFQSPIPMDDVESAESIMRRFVTGAVSFGSISKEAHEAMAEAMNAIGGRSNTGEGGEDPARFRSLPDGRNVRSAVKQIASGRFGVTAEYLVNADEIQIKVAQGAKPGEGGQLLGSKVDEVIAATRHTLPGITLISPPPHHDIYSIEDLKQLIFDMKCINPSARVSVKLVAEAGVGTVAAGVAKAGADMILISGAEGGTGASPVSSIRYAGLPWELGLAEAQQTLVVNGLRGKVSLQTDGQLKTGRDVVIAALLGAEEYGFATAPMVAMGCIMCRKCHTNTCPAGIATQDPERRAKFKGSAAQLISYFRFLAEDVRRQLASMGARSLAEIIGRSDLLVKKQVPGQKASGVDISRMTAVVPGKRMIDEGQSDIVGDIIDKRIVRDAAPALDGGIRTELSYHLTNVDRSVGTMLSGAVARRCGHLPEGTIDITFTGTAGQSFGAFLAEGITFTLEGEANDYVGKGLSGGTISIYHKVEPSEGNVIAGNTLLYGATSGHAYICGSVGERFCVRNSGATAVAEGVGDHCCEYMTGGRVVVLGPAGRNFAAGMSAGVAYVLDEDGEFDRHCNMDMVELSLVEDKADREELKAIIQEHHRRTGSRRAERILDAWDDSIGRFLKVMPIGYKKLLEQKRGLRPASPVCAPLPPGRPRSTSARRSAGSCRRTSGTPMRPGTLRR
jgi:glutamate synthase (NADPH) large chain